MSLWHGYCFNKADQLPAPILTEIPIIKFNPDDEPDIRGESLSGVFYGFSKNRIHTANGTFGWEEYPPGETMFWFFPTDQVHYIIKGRAEMTYSLAGTSHTEQKTIMLEPGDAYVVPRGSRIAWKVAPGEGLRHIGIQMPGTPHRQRRTDKMTPLKE
ncbi:cupin domain-containing protein [Chloroflexota bacterium]